VVGLAVSGYLTYVHYAGIAPACSIVHGCARVQASPYAELAGVPVAVLGLAGYGGILAAVLAPGERARLAAALLAFVGFGFSAYLTYREVFTIHALCQWCVASAVVMTALAGACAARVVAAPASAPGRARPSPGR
jgi:uncharacterized membrane protein